MEEIFKEVCHNRSFLNLKTEREDFLKEIESIREVIDQNKKDEAERDEEFDSFADEEETIKDDGEHIEDEPIGSDY